MRSFLPVNLSLSCPGRAIIVSVATWCVFSRQGRLDEFVVFQRSSYICLLVFVELGGPSRDVIQSPGIQLPVIAYQIRSIL